MPKSVFYLSDGTGITVETLGTTLLTQFEQVEFNKQHFPYLNSKDKVQEIVQQVNAISETDESLPLVFSTIVEPESRVLIKSSNALVFDLFDIFIGPIESKLGIKSSRHVGHSHGMGNSDRYKARIDSVHYTLDHDDGAKINNFSSSDIILLGVSRCGKTPTCLYLALNYGTRAANYPLTPEDLQMGGLPLCLQPHREKIFGLSINPKRLQQIRQERRPNSRYAELAQCQTETRSAEALFQQENIPYLNTSTMSVEEIATHILQKSKLKRRF